MSDARTTPALDILPPPIAGTPRSELHAVANEYERWLPLQQIGQQIFEDMQHADDQALLRKAHAIGQDAETKLKELRIKLSGIPSRDLGELGRKARILRFDCSDWLITEDPLRASVCDDALRMACARPLPEPFPIPDEIWQRFKDLTFDAPPLPWEDQL